MPAFGRWASGALALQLAQLCAAVNKARDLSTVSQSGLKLWVTVDARVDVDGGRVAQWNDISHGENHAKQNAADKSPMMEVSDSAGEEIAFGRNSYLSSQPVQVRAPRAASSPFAARSFEESEGRTLEVSPELQEPDFRVCAHSCSRRRRRA